MTRFVLCAPPDGVLCLDDVFKIRWPGVTEVLTFLLREGQFDLEFSGVVECRASAWTPQASQALVRRSKSVRCIGDRKPSAE